MALSNVRSRYVMANGVKTHYSESGDDGPVLIALHGGGAGSSGVAGMGSCMQRLGDEFRVLAPDGVGGFGLTAPRHRRTMQSNYPGSGKRTERTLSNCLEGGFSNIAAATKVQVYGELALVEIDG